MKLYSNGKYQELSHNDYRYKLYLIKHIFDHKMHATNYSGRFIFRFGRRGTTLATRLATSTARLQSLVLPGQGNFIGNFWC